MLLSSSMRCQKYGWWARVHPKPFIHFSEYLNLYTFIRSYSIEARRHLFGKFNYDADKSANYACFEAPVKLTQFIPANLNACMHHSALLNSFYTLIMCSYSSSFPSRWCFSAIIYWISCNYTDSFYCERGEYIFHGWLFVARKSGKCTEIAAAKGLLGERAACAKTLIQ